MTSFIPKRIKDGHTLKRVSRKSVNKFIDYGLRIISAKPCLYFHQVLSFSPSVFDPVQAKKMFNRFIKVIEDEYKNNELAGLYVMEKRANSSLHFHACFLFFREDKLPFSKTRRRREFRTDIFNRWSKLNVSKLAHVANELVEHKFDLKSLDYFCQALHVLDTSTVRGQTTRDKTNWWGRFNKKAVLSRSTAPTMRQRKAAFNQFFKAGTPPPPKPKATPIWEDLGEAPNSLEEFYSEFVDSSETPLVKTIKQPFRWNNRWQEEKSIISNFIGKLRKEDEKSRLLMVTKIERQESKDKFDCNETTL
jgi:hypothetical protein